MGILGCFHHGSVAQRCVRSLRYLLRSNETAVLKILWKTALGKGIVKTTFQAMFFVTLFSETYLNAVLPVLLGALDKVDQTLSGGHFDLARRVETGLRSTVSKFENDQLQDPEERPVRSRPYGTVLSFSSSYPFP